MKNLAVAFVLAAALVSGQAAAQGLVEWQEQVVSGVCTLRFALPEGWKAETHTPAPGAVQIRLVPKAGPPAEVLISGFAPKEDSSLKSTGDIRKSAKAMGEAMLSGAVEKKIELQKVGGTDGSGFFYILTDKRPELPAGEFRVTTQGVMAVGPLRLGVTVLANEKNSAAAAMTFSLLRTAECATPKH
ncbi:MAG: hypothetical protein ABR961_00780 [Thermoanaerobaculaceae bacterium]|jgi:hypothetical protein